MNDTKIAIGHEETYGVYDWITQSIAMAIKNLYLIPPKDLIEHIEFEKIQDFGKAYVYGQIAYKKVIELCRR